MENEDGHAFLRVGGTDRVVLCLDRANVLIKILVDGLYTLW